MGICVTFAPNYCLQVICKCNPCRHQQRPENPQLDALKCPEGRRKLSVRLKRLHLRSCSKTTLKSPTGVAEIEAETVSLSQRHKTPEYILYAPSVERRGPTACLWSGPLQLTDHNRQTSQRPLGGRISNEVGGDNVHEGGAIASSN